jgi:hypothetical protein
MNTTTTYKFRDLPTQALKDAAIKHHRNINVDYHEWHDCTLDDWKEKLEALGYDDPEIQYSGFWSQGDGASFTSKQVPLPSTDPKVIEAWDQLVGAAELIGTPITEDIADLAYGSVMRHGHQYCHENTVAVDWEWNDPPFYNYNAPDGLRPFTEMLRAAVDAYFENLDEVVTDLCKQIYSDLEEEYEYQTSDESVTAAIEANEIEFEVDEEGELV